MPNELLPLAEAVRSLRAQIIEATEIGSGDLVRFELGPIELEFTLVATREGATSAKIEFKLLGLGTGIDGEAKIASEQTHKVKFTLLPKRTDGGQINIRRTD